MARYRHVIRKGKGGYYVTQGPKHARVIKAGPFRTRNAAWDWLNDHPEAYSVQQRRRRRARSNPVSSSTLYWILGGVGVLGIGGLIYFFTRPSKLMEEEKKRADDLLKGGASGGLGPGGSPAASMAPYSSGFDRTAAFHGF